MEVGDQIRQGQASVGEKQSHRRWEAAEEQEVLLLHRADLALTLGAEGEARSRCQALVWEAGEDHRS